MKNFLENVFLWRSPEKFLWRPLFFFFFFFLEIAWKIFVKTFFFFFFGEHLRLCPWSLALASRVSVLGKAVLGLGLGFFLCPWPWPWPRALCPRLHLCWLDIFLKHVNREKKPRWLDKSAKAILSKRLRKKKQQWIYQFPVFLITSLLYVLNKQVRACLKTNSAVPNFLWQEERDASKIINQFKTDQAKTRRALG